MKQTLLIVLATLNISISKSQTTITGHFSSMQDWSNEVYLLAITNYNGIFLSTNQYQLDTATVDMKGNFQFALNELPCENCLYRIDVRPKGSNGAMIYGGRKENYALFELRKGASLEIVGDANMLTKTVDIKSEPPLWNYTTLRKMRQPIYEAADSIMQIFSNPEQLAQYNIDSIREVGLNKIINASVKNNRTLKEYINRSSNIYDKIVGLMLYDFDEEMGNDIEYYELVLDQLTKDYREHPFYNQLKKDIYEAKYVLPIGSLAPPLILPDSSGNLIDLFKTGENLLLLDFWASWCTPCRHENRVTVKPLMEIYKNKGFMVYSVSMDASKKKWIKAIEADEMNWINVSDLKGKKSKIYSTYKIDGLPTTYLIDSKTNKILAKNIRGDDLKKFVENYFKGE